MPALGGGVFCRCGSVLHRNTPRRRPIPDLRESRAAPTRGEACRDAGKTVRISVAVPSTAGFDRLLPDKGNLPLLAPVKRAILSSKLPAIWRMSD